MSAKVIIYEQPLNERIRLCLRIETLMKRFHYFMALKGDWSGYAALLGILEITALLERGDLKQELMKELGRQHTALESLSAHKEIDKSKLAVILSRQQHAIERLHHLGGKLGEHLKQNDFLLMIRQRTSIPGGSCDFDLPQLRFWLNQAYETRVTDLQRWAAPYIELASVIELVLSAIRDSATAEKVIAENGFFQQNLDPQQSNQLIRVGVAASEAVYPEISAGKHRYSVRFLNPLPIDETPSQIKQDVNFSLAHCSL